MRNVGAGDATRIGSVLWPDLKTCSLSMCWLILAIIFICWDYHHVSIRQTCFPFVFCICHQKYRQITYVVFCYGVIPATFSVFFRVAENNPCKMPRSLTMIPYPLAISPIHSTIGCGHQIITTETRSRWVILFLSSLKGSLSRLRNRIICCCLDNIVKYSIDCYFAVDSYNS